LRRIITIEDYIAIVQKDDVGDLIEICKKNEIKKEEVEGFGIIMSLDEAKKVKNKKFFTFGVPKEIIEYINS